MSELHLAVKDLMVFFVDNQGRILILAADDRDPRKLTKTTGIVNYGDNACIDDVRWKRFLDLARDGTQDYRLTEP